MKSGLNSYLKSKFMGAYIRTPRLELRIDDYISAGCFGAVFHATETSSRRSFAVKIVSKTPNWRQEATFHRSLSAHSNIITLHAVGENGGFGCLIFDYCDGSDLSSSVYGSRAFAGDTETIKHVFLQIIDAVQHCHKNTIYHRDLKLENVLYDSRTGQVFLTDFGVSTNRRWSTEYRAGTVKSMSPECCWEPLVDPRDGGTGYSPEANDVWSLGVMLYNLIAAGSLWACPTMRDPVYASFYYGSDFWRRRAPLSLETVALLESIFVPEKERITLDHLRQAIKQMETFYCMSRRGERRYGPWTRLSREVYAASVERREVHRRATLWDVGERRIYEQLAQSGHGKPDLPSVAHAPVDLPCAASYGMYVRYGYVE